MLRSKRVQGAYGVDKNPLQDGTSDSASSLIVLPQQHNTLWVFSIVTEEAA